MRDSGLAAVELCAGAGGQALGLELAGFTHASAFELDSDAVATLKRNRPDWSPAVIDIRELNGKDFKGVDLLAAGLPCPPFSIAGKQLRSDDERDLFPTGLRLVEEASPAAVLIENVRGLASKRFADYRNQVLRKLRSLGYAADWQVLNASSYGVPQLRPRFLLVAIKNKYAAGFEWPHPLGTPPTVGETLVDLMSAQGWGGARTWAQRANGIGPTLVGGSKKHGGPDLGPTRAKRAWKELGVDGKGIADEAPGPEFPADGLPRLTTRMAARLQGFPDSWEIEGLKTSSYRQVGNAFPPPVAFSVGSAIRTALLRREPAEGAVPLPSILFQVQDPERAATGK